MRNKYGRYSKRIINQSEARTVLKFVFGGTVPAQITETQRRFAQFLLAEMLDKSIAMGFMQSLFESAMKPGASVTSISRKIIQDAATSRSGWFSRSSSDDVKDALDDVKIYRSVRDQLKRNFRSQWVLMRDLGADF